MTFQRYETKYMLSPIMARKLRKSLPGHLQMDEYGLDTICSLYYDTRITSSSAVRWKNPSTKKNCDSAVMVRSKRPAPYT